MSDSISTLLFPETPAGSLKALLTEWVEHTLKSGRRAVVVLGSLRLALVENGKVITLVDSCSSGDNR